MARLCRELNTALPANSILVADGGFAGHWTGLLYDAKSPGRHYPGPRSASIGYGLPGGIRRRSPLRDAGRRDHRRWRVQHDIGERRPRAAQVSADHRRRQQRASGYARHCSAMFRGATNLPTWSRWIMQHRPGDGCNGIRVEDPDQLGTPQQCPVAATRPSRRRGRHLRSAPCCPPSTTARSRSSRAIGSHNLSNGRNSLT
jgi:hypothetical protein